MLLLHYMINIPLTLKTFYTILGNNLIAGTTNMFVWFAITFWVYLETQSVLATSWIAGIFAVANMLGAMAFGTYVDHHKKKTSFILSSSISLLFYLLGSSIYFLSPSGSLSEVTSPLLWLMIIVLMIGSVAGNLRMIALSTIVTMLFEEGRDKANGMVGMTQGIVFSLTSILSGLAIGFLDMGYALIFAVGATALVLFHSLTIPVEEKEIVHVEGIGAKVDWKGTLTIVLALPGLLALIFFQTFNNFLGGVFMALMDAYGLSLVSVEVWGLMWGVVSLAMIVGSVYVARRGVGKNPLRTILLINLISWTTCIFFPLYGSVIPLTIGMLVWLLFMPIAEAAEQTVIQNIVPFERQGRVFGFAQSIESMASPVTTFLVGPLAQFVFIPFMTVGSGVTLLGPWFGTGADRGIALVFICAGALGALVTLLAFHSRAYSLLSAHYQDATKEKPAS
jgi:MFS transporter, DHA3 family, multidrug efflux protein